MARDRSVRYSSAHEFIAALSHVRANLASYAAPPRKATASVAPPAPIPPAQRGSTPSSASAPPLPASRASVEASAAALVRRRSPKDFDEVSTQIDSLVDFSLSSSDENDATTTLTEGDEAARTARARELAGEDARSAHDDVAGSDSFDAGRTEVTKGPVPRIVDQYADETVRMERPEPPPSTLRIPKRR
jgi:hypothetical protein